MKHAIAEFLGQSRKDSLYYYSTDCGLRIRLREPAEDESIPVDVPGEGAWCPVCHPEHCQQQLEGASLHPDVGGLEVDDDVVAEDRGDEEIIKEEIIEG